MRTDRPARRGRATQGYGGGPGRATLLTGEQTRLSCAPACMCLQCAFAGMRIRVCLHVCYTCSHVSGAGWDDTGITENLVTHPALSPRLSVSLSLFHRESVFPELDIYSALGVDQPAGGCTPRCTSPSGLEAEALWDMAQDCSTVKAQLLHLKGLLQVCDAPGAAGTHAHTHTHTHICVQ